MISRSKHRSSFRLFFGLSYNTVIDSRGNSGLTSEGLRNLKNLLGNESVVAECSGVNYNVYVTESRVLVGKRFTLGESVVNVPHSNVSTLELITKSIIPPMTLAILAIVGIILVWWFPGQQRLAIPSYPYDYVAVGVASILFGSIVGAWWRRQVGVLRIGIAGTQEPITVRLVSNSRASAIFHALKA